MNSYHCIEHFVLLVFISPESIINNPRFRNMLLSAPYTGKTGGSLLIKHIVSKIGETNFQLLLQGLDTRGVLCLVM